MAPSGCAGRRAVRLSSSAFRGLKFTASNFPNLCNPGMSCFAAMSCPLGYFAAEMAEIQRGETVVVVGAGPVGLCAMTAARLWRPARIVAVDTSPFRLEAALKAGVADLVLDPAKDNVVEAIRGLTGGFGADRTIECAGRQMTFDIAFSAVRGGGKISTVGIYEKPLSLPLNTAWGTNLSLSWGFAPIDRLPRTDSIDRRGEDRYRFPVYAPGSSKRYSAGISNIRQQAGKLPENADFPLGKIDSA